MIVRVWHAEIAAENVPPYRDLLDRVVFPQLRRIIGFLGAELLLSEESEQVRIMFQSRWESLDAVNAFAGPDLARAVVEPEARALLARFDDRVAHYELALETHP